MKMFLQKRSYELMYKFHRKTQLNHVISHGQLVPVYLTALLPNGQAQVYDKRHQNKSDK